MRTHESRFRTRLLAGACAAVAAATPFSAYAQDATPAAAPADDDIVVTGIRASLERAIDIKRNADVIVDSIASEDLGKFPDSNVAESLQRITGVSIDRNAGEGQFVTVRGFGPSFNTVLLNGRTLATENDNRAFSFDLLAAELISGADVYKSSNAKLQDGGIGATINVKTLRPFDLGGQKIVVSGKANYEDLADKFAGSAFGLFSTTTADDRLGALVSVSYQRRKALVNTLATNGYFLTRDVPSAPGGVLFPQNYDQISDQQDRERIGVTGTVQFRATDKLTLSFDGLYNKFTVDSEAASIGHFFSPSQARNLTVNGDNQITAMTVSGNTDYIGRTFNRPTEVLAFGFNAEWNPTDLITVTSDSSYSRAESNNGGNEVFAVVGFNNIITFDNRTGSVPSVAGQRSFTENVVGRAHFATREGFNIAEDVYEQRLDATFRTESGILKAFKVGGYFLDRTKSNELLRSQNDVGCAYCGYAIDVPAGLLTPYNPPNFFSGTSGNFPRQWLAFDQEEYFAFLESTAAANAQDAAVGRPIGSLAAFLAANNGYAPIRYPVSYRIGERIIGGYVQTDFEGTLAGLNWSGTLGFRYVHTDVTSDGSQQALLDLLTIPSDPTSYTTVFEPGSTAISRKNSYDDFLPSLNLKVDFTDDIVGRFAASRTVTRPDLPLLAPRVTVTNARPGNLQASGGNPDLRPYKSTNFDVSFEWYYERGGYFTVAAFYKRVDDFIATNGAIEPFPIANASNAPEFAGGVANFNVQRPRNLDAIDVYGLEIGLQHTFTYLPSPLDGLGITANATFVGSSGEFDASDPTQNVALTGLGDSQNVTVFYEKGPVQARIAYNRRDEFLQALSAAPGNRPVFVRPLGQFDAQASYQVTKNVRVFAEGVNLTGAKTRRQGVLEREFIALVDTGPRYALGARLDF